MKLKHLLQESANFIVYKVSSPHTDRVYYGYGQGQSMEDIKKLFLAGARRGDAPDRGDGKMLLAAKEDIESLKFEMVDVSPDEIEAFTVRNDNRASDSASITGPTAFPGNVYKRALQLHPDRVKSWKIQRDLNSMTAREAMSVEQSQLKFPMVKKLVQDQPDLHNQVKTDLDGLTYPAFMAKYFPQA